MGILGPGLERLDTQKARNRIEGNVSFEKVHIEYVHWQIFNLTQVSACGMSTGYN